MELLLTPGAVSKVADSFPDESKRVTENLFLIAGLPFFSPAKFAGIAGMGGAGVAPTELDLILFLFSPSDVEADGSSSNICAKERLFIASLEAKVDCPAEAGGLPSVNDAS